MKVDSISLTFTDVNNDVAKLEVTTTPPVTIEEMEPQPCLDLANQVITMLQYAKEQANGAAISNGKSGNTLH